MSSAYEARKHGADSYGGISIDVAAPERRDDYRGWQIDHYPPPIPCRDFDWTATHPDFDGSGDDRQVWGRTWDAVRAEIDGWYKEQAA